MATVLMPLPATDFDPTESAVPWRALTGAGHEVAFATPDGQPAGADERLLTGRGFGPWRPFLRTARPAREAYASMAASDAFLAPRRWDASAAGDADAVVLPGGHAPGMRPYLESGAVQELAATLLAAGKPVGAICHGVLVLARARGALAGRRCTALPRWMELSAWWMTRWWLGSYYRTYPETVEAEVERLGGAFERGPRSLLRDAPARLGRGFVVRDGNLITARWPGDAHRFAQALVDALAGR